MTPSTSAVSTYHTPTTFTTLLLHNSTVPSQQSDDSLESSDDGVIRGLNQITIPQGVAALQCTVLSILWVLALPGNILVFVVIQRSRRVQSTTNYFVKSLAVSDILLVLMTSPSVCLRIIVNEWMAGHVLCRLIRFLQLSNMACSSFVLVAICADRFYTIIYPLSFKVTRGTAKRTILVAWMSSVLLSLCSIYFFDLVYEPINPSDANNTTNERRICPTFVPASVMAGLVYAYTIVIIYFILPVFFTTIGYLRIMCYIHRTRISIQNNRMPGSLIPRRKVKMARTLLIITASTLVLYLPFYITQLVYCVGWEDLISPYVFNTAYCLIAISAAIKPVVYACRNSIFWRGCQEVLCMSGMKCYRVNTYSITKVSTIAKKNFVGVMELSQESYSINGGLSSSSTFHNNKGVLSSSRSDTLPTTTF